MLLILKSYCYFGLDLLSQDKCGDAIKALQLSQKCKKKYFANVFDFYECFKNLFFVVVFFVVYEETEQLCKTYANTKGHGTQAIPERHQFFKNLGSIISRAAEKCDRENGMM